MDRLIVGTIQAEKQHVFYPEREFRWVLSGAWRLRQGEIKAIPGATKRPHGWGYTLPADTPQEVIDRVAGDVYAAPRSADWTRIENNHYIEYRAPYADTEIRVVVWADALVVEVQDVTLARVVYNMSVECQRQESGDWLLKERYSRRASKFSFDSPTEAAWTEFYGKIAPLLAGFIAFQKQAFVEAQQAETRQTRERIEAEIAEHQAAIVNLKEQLAALEVPQLA